jgi:hypothetical protein
MFLLSERWDRGRIFEFFWLGLGLQEGKDGS